MTIRRSTCVHRVAAVVEGQGRPDRTRLRWPRSITRDNTRDNIGDIINHVHTRWTQNENVYSGDSPATPLGLIEPSVFERFPRPRRASVAYGIL